METRSGANINFCHSRQARQAQRRQSMTARVSSRTEARWTMFWSKVQRLEADMRRRVRVGPGWLGRFRVVHGLGCCGILLLYSAVDIRASLGVCGWVLAWDEAAMDLKRRGPERTDHTWLRLGWVFPVSVTFGCRKGGTKDDGDGVSPIVCGPLVWTGPGLAPPRLCFGPVRPSLYEESSLVSDRPTLVEEPASLADCPSASESLPAIRPRLPPTDGISSLLMNPFLTGPSSVSRPWSIRAFTMSIASRRVSPVSSSAARKRASSLHRSQSSSCIARLSNRTLCSLAVASSSKVWRTKR